MNTAAFYRKELLARDQRLTEFHKLVMSSLSELEGAVTQALQSPDLGGSGLEAPDEPVRVTTVTAQGQRINPVVLGTAHAQIFDTDGVASLYVRVQIGANEAPNWEVPIRMKMNARNSRTYWISTGEDFKAIEGQAILAAKQVLETLLRYAQWDPTSDYASGTQSAHVRYMHI